MIAEIPINNSGFLLERYAIKHLKRPIVHSTVMSLLKSFVPTYKIRISAFPTLLETVPICKVSKINTKLLSLIQLNNLIFFSHLKIIPLPGLVVIFCLRLLLHHQLLNCLWFCLLYVLRPSAHGGARKN